MGIRVGGGSEWTIMVKNRKSGWKWRFLVLFWELDV